MEEYVYKDWRGHLLDPQRNTNVLNGVSKDKFNIPTTGITEKDPKNTNGIDMPFSTRESYLLFDDNRTDYFKHGLQIIDNLNNLLFDGENPINNKTRLDNFKSTPFEQNDPVIFGFDIIIDVENSPLLNGAIDDFLSSYSNIGEVASRIPIYEDFKQQFIKFFKTKSSVSIQEDLVSITKMRNSSYPESSRNPFQGRDMGKKAYLSYYLNKIEGLDKLVEQNTADKKRFLTNYNKDVINLYFNEDVSLSLGTLSHLYKMLYWSKPNGKTIIPENLLRFNCDIVISELRNYNRVIKAIDTNQIQIIKDNVSRYVYSLYDCQFYFSNMPHESSIDIGGSGSPDVYDRYKIEFDYKYSTLNFERFVPAENNFGKYAGINNAAMWRVNTNTRSNDTTDDASVWEQVPPKPYIFTSNNNLLGQKGVEKPLILSIPQKKTFSASSEKSPLEIEKSKALLLKQNKATALLNKTLNKVVNANLQLSIRPPRNIYTEGRFNPQDLNSLSGAGARIFYDVRGELFNFLGDVGGIIGNRNRSF